MSDEELYPDEDLPEADFDRLNTLLRSMTDSDHVNEAPPASVWDSISAELSNEAVADVIPIGASTRPDVAKPANVTDLSSRRGPRLLAAAAILVIAALGIAGLVRSQPDEFLVASVDIVNDDLPVADDAFGSARLISVDGDLQLEIDVEGLEADSGYLELWIINGDVTDMHSLGEIDGDGRFDLPDDVDPANFPIVDISFEERDGVETHSGNSVLRGVLDV